jgi:hypothetical protein
MNAIGGSGHGQEPAISIAAAAPFAGRPCRVFVSYAQTDEAFRTRLDVHLAPLVREGLIDLWCDRAIDPGSDWERDIRHELAVADVVVLLVTPDFVASAYCFEKELTEALRRHEEEGVRIVPVYVKAVDLLHLSFRRFQGLPADLRPITAWPHADDAWLQVAQGVRRTAEEINGTRTTGLPRPRGAPPESSSRLGRELQDYYGADRCVVDGPVADGKVEWIPLRGEPAAMRFDNMVPVSRRYRTRAPGRPAAFRFGIDLRADNLFHSARRHFHAGVPELAYGCARLGDVLAADYPYEFEVYEGDDWAFLAQSLFYLPYRTHGALLADTLLRVRRRLGRNNNCPGAGRAALLMAVANLYQDAGRWAVAEELYDQVLATRPAPFMQIAAVRRRAVGRIFRGLAVERDLRRVGDYATNADLAVSLALSQGWWHLAHGRAEECLRLLTPFDFDEEADTAAYSPHNAVEFKLTMASALIALGLPHAAQLRFVEERARGRAHLRPVFTEYVAPLLLARELGEAVASFAVPVVVPRALDVTADALLAARGTTVAGRPIWVD